MEDNHNKGFVVMMFSVAIVLIVFMLVLSFNKKENGIYVYFFTEGGTPVEKIKINVGDNINLPTTSRNGYTFLGWYKSDIKVSNLTRYNETTTLFAKWLKEGSDTFTITFDSNEGTEVENLIVECNKALKLPLNPIKDGYEFVSWLDNNNNPVLDESILECRDITLKAEWKKIEAKNEIKEITYTCPAGYNLIDKKCSIEKNAMERCPSNSILDGDICISQIDNNVGNIICKNNDVETDNGIQNVEGEYFNGKCGYYVYTNLKEDDCNYVWDNNKCYAKVIEGGYDKSCSEGYTLKDDTCKKIIEKELYCETGYNLNNNKCIRTIDATIR